MPVAKYRDLDKGDVLPASWTDALQEFISTLVSNVRLTLASATTIQVVAGSGSAQAAAGIEGLWRYRSTTASVVVSGAAGSRNVYLTASANTFGGADADTTDYNFTLVALTGTPTGVAGYRKIGELQWDGAKVTQLRQTVGHDDATLPITPTAPAVDVSAVRVLGAAGQAAAILTVGSAASSPTDLLVVGPAGVGFFGASPVDQAARPTTLNEVITVLADLGLTA